MVVPSTGMPAAAQSASAIASAIERCTGILRSRATLSSWPLHSAQVKTGVGAPERECGAAGTHLPSGRVPASFVEEMASLTARSSRPASKTPSRDCERRSESCVQTISRLVKTSELAGGGAGASERARGAATSAARSSAPRLRPRAGRACGGGAGRRGWLCLPVLVASKPLTSMPEAKGWRASEPPRESATSSWSRARAAPAGRSGGGLAHESPVLLSGTLAGGAPACASPRTRTQPAGITQSGACT